MTVTSQKKVRQILLHLAQMIHAKVDFIVALVAVDSSTDANKGRLPTVTNLAFTSFRVSASHTLHFDLLVHDNFSQKKGSRSTK